MSNINNQTKSLTDIAAVQELTDETAAVIQGGYALELYKHVHNGYEGLLGLFNKGGKAVLSQAANDQISGIIIRAGRWQFFEHANYQGRKITLGVGEWNLGTSPLNDRISSFRRVA